MTPSQRIRAAALTERLRDLAHACRLEWAPEEVNDVNEAADELDRLTAELDEHKKSAAFCEKHKPNGGHRAMCLVCACQNLSAALSRISYLCGEPNEMECGPYDVHCDESAVVSQVERLTARVAELEKDAERQNKLMFLASHDVVFFGGFIYNPDERSFVVPRPLILCNDFFAPAADCEEFEPSDIDEIFSIYEKWGDPGVLAWVSLKRGGENPWRLKPTYKFHDDFLKARSAIDAARRTE